MDILVERRPRGRRAVPKLSEFDAVASSFFGNLRLLAGCPKQIVEANLGLEQHNPNTDAEGPLRPARLKTDFGYRMPDAFSDLFGIISGSSWQKDSEFITSDAADQIATSHR
jgi:hypothetical protein